MPKSFWKTQERDFFFKFSAGNFCASSKQLLSFYLTGSVEFITVFSCALSAEKVRAKLAVLQALMVCIFVRFRLHVIVLPLFSLHNDCFLIKKNSE